MFQDTDGKYVLPAVTPKGVASKAFDDYAVKYKKVDLDDDGEVLELQQIQTRALRDPDDVMILSEDKMTFMSSYIVVVKYLEKVRT